MHARAHLALPKSLFHAFLALSAFSLSAFLDALDARLEEGLFPPPFFFGFAFGFASESPPVRVGGVDGVLGCGAEGVGAVKGGREGEFGCEEGADVCPVLGERVERVQDEREDRLVEQGVKRFRIGGSGGICGGGRGERCDGFEMVQDGRARDAPIGVLQGGQVGLVRVDEGPLAGCEQLEVRSGDERVRVERGEVVHTRAGQSMQLDPPCVLHLPVSLYGKQGLRWKSKNFASLDRNHLRSSSVDCFHEAAMSTYASDLTASLSTALVQLAPTLVPSSPLAQTAPPAGGLAPPDQLGATQSDSGTLTEARQDREAQLRRVLAQLQPPHASSSSSSSAAAPSQAGASSSSSAALNGNQSHRLHAPQDLANLARSLFPSSGSPFDTAGDPQLATVEYVVLAQLAIAAYGTVLRTLMHEAHRLESSDQYWSTVESQPLDTALYLVQSSPERALSLGRVSLARFKQLALSAQSKGGSRPAILSRETWRRAVPPSLFLTAVFPHLSTSAGLPSLASIYNDGGGEQPQGEAANSVRPTSAAAAAAAAAVAPANLARLGRQTARSLLFLTLSPLSLTRAEIAHKRRSLRQQRDRLATMIGELTLAANAGGAVEPSSEAAAAEEEGGDDDDDEGGERVTKADLRRRPGLAQLFGLAAQQEDREGTATLSLEDVKQATFQTLNHLETVLSPASAGAGPQMTDQEATAPRTPAQLARQLADLLTGTLTAHETSFRSSAHALAPPSALARAWPYLLSAPLVGGIIARTVYNHRASLRLWVQETVSTVRGFLIDWVVEPVRQILETLRGGEEGGIALMGRESLQSDLASLERMVVDFARDEYKLEPEELQVLAQQVRAGDLTPVLRVWEEDIKVRCFGSG